MVHSEKVPKILSLFLFLSVLIFFLGACSNPIHSKPISPARNEKKKASLTDFNGKWKIPISIPEGEFYKISGWISEDQVLYITNHEQTSNVYHYNLLSGKSVLVYKSDHPIVTVQISPSKRYILIQSSPSTYEGVVTVINTKGSEIWKQSIAAYELAFEWNPYNDSEILVSKFNEDWTFKMMLVDLKGSPKASDISLPQPFNKWIDKETLAYINWDNTNPSLFAPLMIKELGDEKEKTISPAVFQFTAFRHLLLTITVNEQDKSKAIYSFYDKEKRPISTFTIPQLTTYSDWLVPFNDYNDKKQEFISFRPLKSTEFDSYTEGYQLVSYDLKKGSSKLILGALKNEPLNFSPSGEACLYGNSFEKVIDLKAKKIYELIKNESK
ncbi:YqgU-like beta propeller domain-containing protein [Neobacillus ginsengisoli]|uniref:YqgU-like 6-bladed beta-propeller domain-containing protein n=1 Tax=Neobacillus ginsengisoli TaxID=904295 RepID=A0ABT9XP34_9BACI|nr:hypothetical protein [Neobacillus ginsengisoli]MDQ0197305.1 hypothetical protein [Neobacillus ginsengisoli]